jgi:hypothetical protein
MRRSSRPRSEDDPCAQAQLIAVDSPAYRHALTEVGHDVYHRPGYVLLEARTADAAAVAYCYREGPRVLLLPLVVRPVPGTAGPSDTAGLTDAVSPYGYPGPVVGGHRDPADDQGFWSRAVDALPGTLASAGVVACFVRLHPLLPADIRALARVGTIVRHGETVSVDLTLDEATQWARIRANHRRQIIRARRAGLVSTFGDWGRLDEFVEVYHETMTRVGADAMYFFDGRYVAGLREALGDDLHLVTVVQSTPEPDAAPAAAPGELLGAGLFLTAGGIVQYHLGASRNRHLRWQPAKLMMDDVRRWATDAGRTTLHLGGGLGGRSDDSLFHFKAGFGSGRTPFHSWRVVCDPAAYRRLCAQSVDGAAHAAENEESVGTGFFPAYRLGRSA